MAEKDREHIGQIISRAISVSIVIILFSLTPQNEYLFMYRPHDIMFSWFAWFTILTITQPISNRITAWIKKSS